MKTIDQKYKNEIEVERLWVTTNQGEYVVFTMLPISMLMIFALWSSSDHGALLVWFFSLIAVNLFRWKILRFYNKNKNSLGADIKKFKGLMLLGSCLVGLAWVSAILLFLKPSDPTNVLLIAVALVFQIEGAVGTWYCYLPAVLAISFPPLVILIALLFSEGSKVYSVTAFIFLLLAFSIVITSIKLAKMLNYALLLNFENAALRKDYEEKSMLLETALENMEQGIVMSGKDDRLRLWNRQFLTILGAAGEKVEIDVSLANILNVADPPISINLEGQTVYRIEDDKVYEVRQSELKQGGRVITFTDITDMMKRERSLKNARKEAIEANCAKIRFLATASHDLRQPIHALGLFFAQLSDRVRSPETAQVIGQIEDSIEAINTMLNALLDVSKLDAGIIKPNTQAVSLTELFERLSFEFKPLALENKNELRIRPVSANVHTDPVLLERILRNLIGNAIRYTKNGRILVATRIRGKNLEIKIIDTGIGIPEDKFDEIFVEFHQLHNQARDRRQGLGLGLAIVKRLANLLHHEVKVTSQPGRGSCFSITLPWVPKNINPFLPPNDEAVLGSICSFEGYRLLVIEDDIAVRDGMKGLLTRWGCDVITAGTSEEAAEKLADPNSMIDFMIVDYRLPDNVSGIDVARNLRSHLNNPADVLIITGDTGPERLQEAEVSGFPLLHKPVQPAKLRSTLQHLIRKNHTKKHDQV